MSVLPFSNRLLESLSPAAVEAIQPLMQHVILPWKWPLHEPHAEPKFAYFMTGGVGSSVIELQDGGSVEVGLVGNEGMIGAAHLLGPRTSPTFAFMQVEGSGYRIPMAQMREIFRDNAEIRSRVLEFAQHQVRTLSMFAACNRLHAAEVRLSRWLLMTRDRLDSDILHLTQEFLAEMLGTQRTTLAVVAAELQRMGAIEYRRGSVRIVSRPMLERCACECYRFAKEALESLYQLEWNG